MQPNYPLPFNFDLNRPQVLSSPVDSILFEPLSFELKNELSLANSIGNEYSPIACDIDDIPSFSPLSHSNSLINLNTEYTHHDERYNLSVEQVATLSSLADGKSIQNRLESKRLKGTQESAVINPFALLPSQDAKYTMQNTNDLLSNGSQMPSLDTSPDACEQPQLDRSDLSRDFISSDIQSKQHGSFIYNDFRKDSLQNRVCDVLKGEMYGKAEPKVPTINLNNVREERVAQPSNLLGVERSTNMILSDYNPTACPTREQFNLDDLLQPGSAACNYAAATFFDGLRCDEPITNLEISQGPEPLANDLEEKDPKPRENQLLGKRNLDSVEELVKDLQGSTQHKKQKKEQEEGPEDDTPIAQWFRLKRRARNENKSGRKEEQTRAEQLKLRRAMRNRESARRSRIKSKIQFQTLEQRHNELSVENTALINLVQTVIPPSLRLTTKEALDASTSF